MGDVRMWTEVLEEILWAIEVQGQDRENAVPRCLGEVGQAVESLQPASGPLPALACSAGPEWLPPRWGLRAVTLVIPVTLTASEVGLPHWI